MVAGVIVAAGRGTRMGPNIDKIFLEVAGRPLIAHTWARFDQSPSIDELILVIRSGMENDFEEIRAQFGFRKPVQFVPGGAERQNSVWNGLQATSASAEIVAIQDGARPCTTEQIIAEVIAAARETGAAVAAQKVTDTLKEGGDQRLITRNLDRSKLWSVQTPQVFRREVILRALAEVTRRGLSVTDDTAACELIGQPVRLVESLTPNPKLTAPADLPFLELLLKQ